VTSFVGDTLLDEQVDLDEAYSSTGPGALWTKAEFSNFVGIKKIPPVVRTRNPCVLVFFLFLFVVFASSWHNSIPFFGVDHDVY
jgi:hypothetical protein